MPMTSYLLLPDIADALVITGIDTPTEDVGSTPEVRFDLL